MRESPLRRLAYASVFALFSGVLVAWCNPVADIGADLRTDFGGLTHVLRIAARDLGQHPARS